ncbi:MAG: cyclic nucleotide-binding domain-containing protein, partial [Alphaproteobacteria bacterium]
MTVQLLKRETEKFDRLEAELICFEGAASTANRRPRGRNSASACEGCNAHKRAICADLRDLELEEFASQSRTRLIKTGEVVYHEGDPAKYLYTIISGEVRLVNLLNDGRRQVSGFKTSGDLLGDQKDGCYLYNAEAVCDVIVCKMPLKALETYLEKMPVVRKALLAKMQEEVDALRNHMLVLGRKTPIEKIASFLVNRAQKLEIPSRGT